MIMVISNKQPRKYTEKLLILQPIGIIVIKSKETRVQWLPTAADILASIKSL